MKSPEQIVTNIFIILGVLLTAAAVGCICYFIYDRLRTAKAPTRRVQAKVARKKQTEHSLDLDGGAGTATYDSLGMLLSPGDGPEVTLYQSWDYFVTFAFEGRMEEFHVPESIYTSLSEGDEGILIYKGSRVEFFMHKT